MYLLKVMIFHGYVKSPKNVSIYVLQICQSDHFWLKDVLFTCWKTTSIASHSHSPQKSPRRTRWWFSDNAWLKAKAPSKAKPSPRKSTKQCHWGTRGPSAGAAYVDPPGDFNGKKHVGTQPEVGILLWSIMIYRNLSEILFLWFSMYYFCPYWRIWAFMW